MQAAVPVVHFCPSPGRVRSVAWCGVTTSRAGSGSRAKRDTSRKARLEGACAGVDNATQVRGAVALVAVFTPRMRPQWRPVCCGRGRARVPRRGRREYGIDSRVAHRVFGARTTLQILIGYAAHARSRPAPVLLHGAEVLLVSCVLRAVLAARRVVSPRTTRAACSNTRVPHDLARFGDLLRRSRSRSTERSPGGTACACPCTDHCAASLRCFFTGGELP